MSTGSISNRLWPSVVMDATEVLVEMVEIDAVDGFGTMVWDDVDVAGRSMLL